MSNDVTQFVDVLNQLKSGSNFVKQKFNGKKFSRRFYLHEREGYISYEKSHKLFGKPRIYHVKDIDEIRPGIHGPRFDRLLQKRVINNMDDQRVFTILYDNHRKEEHIITPDFSTRELWIQGLRHLMDRHAQKTQYHLIQEQKWILDFFHAADKNRSNTLSKSECRELLANKFNVELPQHIFEQMFHNADKSKEGLLNSDEFINFFQLLTRRKDLYAILKDHANLNYTQPIETVSINANQLLSFLRLHYKQTMRSISLEEVQQLIREFELNKELRDKDLLGTDGFRNMLLSEYFDIVSPFHTRQIYQDMTRPLCDYYINTSHNTYLFYSQISGDSNPEAYNRVLLMGCRAVELDCYDGDNGSPIVTHAHTLVKPCSFESIIRSIEPNLFKASPYPVILNIENHCSLEQQRQMALILKRILGDRLITKPLPSKNPLVLPSPEDLKHKVLIRSKKLSSAVKKRQDDDDDDEDNDTLLNPLSKDVQPELAALFVYLQNVPFREYDYARANYSSFQSSSLAENRFYKFAQSDPIGLVQQTTWRLLRLYPGGLRQDSSNPDPIVAWNFGVQMVALNYQNDDDMIALCHGKFLDNGGCGYILKPDYLRHAEDTEFDPWDIGMNFDHSQTVTITIISGQFLPRSNLKSSDIPDPFVRLSTHGMRCDEHVVKTRPIDNNGFDPIWNEQFRFRIKFPQMCLIYFCVMDYDLITNNDRLAYFCSPITMLQTGYRHIRLRANNGDQTHSTLFVRVDIQRDGVYDDDDDYDGDNIISTRL
ncbi:unnamed protein product [Adineta ricciae]|uniref:Phosphoinositide phospholipase C n=1 Tax=Adineta ricciae TaxID=249248 RepID=A0A813YJS5_ADIRI|nr:unnamed protein product [Adineta ricciae]CAF1240919.1 unnamed protein product [Adineta ricciae]